jgi:UDP-GlcNAc:undecaprenyl-phosphate GlcNAc-1-phosphate transferase
MLNLILILIFLITVFLFNKYNDKLSIKLKLIDIPNKRKIHKKPIPLTGGILFFILLIEVIILHSFFQDYEFQLTKLLLFCSIFVLGLIDDLKDIDANLKLFCLFLIVFLFLLFSIDFQINLIKLSFITSEYSLGNFGLFFTILCILLLINALNMSDGINGLFLGYSIIYFLFLYFSYEMQNIYLILIITILIICFIFNVFNKFFLGDNGVYLVSILLSLELISAYKTDLSNLKNADEIFLLLMMPGLDMLRLFCQRIKNKINPFKADNNHLHHLISKNIDKTSTLLVCLSLSIIPIFLFKFGIMSILNSIITGLFFYFLILLFFLNKTNNFQDEK